MVIESYSFGSIKIDGTEYNTDIIICGMEIKSNWWRKEGHTLFPEDLDWVLDRKPGILIIGTGYYGVMRVPEDTVNFLNDKGIELIIKRSQEACKEYNSIKNKNTIALAIHLTC